MNGVQWVPGHPRDDLRDALDEVSLLLHCPTIKHRDRDHWHSYLPVENFKETLSVF
jgi:hypothetical protein